MARATTFQNLLDGLWRARSAEIRSLVVAQPGKPKTLTKVRRERSLSKLLDLAAVLRPRDLAGRALDAYEKVELELRRKGVRRGADDRYERLKEWVESEFRHRSMVYVFLRGKKCLYVGQGVSGGRLLGYRRDAFFREASRVVMYLVPKGKLDLVECLAMHLYKPVENRVSARRNGRKKCPVCRAQHHIRDEIRTIFVA